MAQGATVQPTVTISGPTDLQITSGPSAQLTASGSPAGGAYSWTSSDNNVVSLSNQNSATVSLTGIDVGSVIITVTYTLNGVSATAQHSVNVVATPTHFTQTAYSIQPNGILTFTYSWLSTTGNPEDLTSCQVREHVTYPGGLGIFTWPSPPYVSGVTNDNPLDNPMSATFGGFGDTQDHPGFVGPYITNYFEATQEFQWQCSNYNSGSWNDFVTYPIDRVVDLLGPSWYYTVTKAGISSTLIPLP